jgi:hypothetical protein
MRSYEKIKPSTSWESSVLSYDPFSGDFSEPGDVLFQDRIVMSRTQYTCCYCHGIISKGTRRRYQALKLDGNVRSYHYCISCCKAMALYWTDDGLAIEKRIDLHKNAP